MRTTILAALILLLASASGTDASPEKDLARAGNEFCLDLYARSRNAEGNLAFSPYSITSALAMTYAGARGLTEEEMARVLHLPSDQVGTHAASASLRKALLDTAAGAGCTLSVANRLWGDAGIAFLKPFLATTREAYGAELEKVDFVNESEAARLRINDWTLDQTGGMIPDLLQQGSITPLTSLVLTNAIYFKARWQAEFKSAATRDGPFYPSAAETLQVPMMRRTGRHAHARADGVQVLVLKYIGGASSMVVLLPDAIDGLTPVEQDLTPKQLEKWIAAAKEKEVSITIPRFRVTSSFLLADALSAMGMPSAFTGSADFSGMDGKRDLFISSVVHKAVVDVGEKGTEAAAATAVVMERTSVISMAEPVIFVADHPFLFVIRDDETGCILFIGRVVKPSA